MNWVGGARNRLKLKNENKLQKEFFERKRQQKSNARTVITKRMGKIRGKQSQDMSSLEVIMSAHRNEQKREKGSNCPTQQQSKAIYKKPKKQEFAAKSLQQHIIPELSPVRQSSQLQPQLLKQEKEKTAPFSNKAKQFSRRTNLVNFVQGRTKQSASLALCKRHKSSNVSCQFQVL